MFSLAPGQYEIVRAGAQSATILFNPELNEAETAYSLRFSREVWAQLPKGPLRDLLYKTYYNPAGVFQSREDCFSALARAGFEAIAIGFVNIPAYSLDIRMDFGSYIPEEDWYYPAVEAGREVGGLSYLKVSVNYSASE